MYKVIHPQAAAAAATQLPAHLTPPTSLVSNIRYYAFCIWKFTIIVFPGGKAAFDSAHYRYVPNISFTIETCQDCVEFYSINAAPHGGQALYTSIAQSPIGQQVFMPASQPAAIFGHTHHSMGPALPQSPVMYLQSPVHPHSFGQQGFIPPPQLGGSTAGDWSYL